MVTLVERGESLECLCRLCELGEELASGLYLDGLCLETSRLECSRVKTFLSTCMFLSPREFASHVP